MRDMHLEDQAIELKKLYYKYNAKRLVIDANGLGIGFIDYMVKSQEDKDSGKHYPDFGIFKGTQADAQDAYKQFETHETQQNAMYLFKGNAPVNTEMYANFQAQLNAGKIKFLMDEKTAKAKLLEMAAGKKMSYDKRSSYLQPFTLTGVLKEEMLKIGLL